MNATRTCRRTASAALFSVVLIGDGSLYHFRMCSGIAVLLLTFFKVVTDAVVLSFAVSNDLGRVSQGCRELAINKLSPSNL